MDDVQNNETQEQKTLIETIALWPDWKLKSLCLDETDLEILRIVNKWRIEHNMKPCE